MHRKHACAHEKTTVGMTERARTARARAPVLHCPQQPGGHQLSTLEPRTCARRQWLSCMHRSNTHTDMQHSTQREQHWNTDTCITTRRCSRDAVLDPWACSNSTRTSSAHNMHAGITEACRTERNGDIVMQYWATGPWICSTGTRTCNTCQWALSAQAMCTVGTQQSARHVHTERA